MTTRNSEGKGFDALDVEGAERGSRSERHDRADKSTTAASGHKKPAHVLDIANQSGFPLQIAVAQAVTHRAGGDWEVSQLEQYWRNERLDRDGYIDLIVRDSHDFYCLVCECKRPQDSQWVFMAADGADRQSKSRVLASHATKPKNPAIPSRRLLEWTEVFAVPPAPEAMFCAVRGAAEPGRHGTLERMASEVVAATEALAQSELEMVHVPNQVRCYASVIVTTAQLFFVEFEPSAVDIATGTLSPDAKTKSVPMVRLRKQLNQTHRRYSELDSALMPQELAAQLEQTVFVVNSAAFELFLAAFDTSGGQRRALIQRYVG